MMSSMIGALMGAATLTLLTVPAPSMAQPPNALSSKAAILILDASGSMWGQLPGGTSKIEVARDVMGQFLLARDASVPLGVIAYGHNRRGDCGDIEVIAKAGVQDAAALSSRLKGLTPRGMTPISESLRVAARQIPPTAEEADIILVTDGLETCNADPCAVAAQLAREGIKIRAHVVGFGLTRQEAAALSCVPDQTGGQLLRPQTGAELTAALNQIAAAKPAPSTPLLRHHFVFGDTGTGTPRGRMAWRAESPDGAVVRLGVTEGTQQSIEGLAGELPSGTWTVVAEGPEGRAERTLELTKCCAHLSIPFTGVPFAAEIPPISDVQAGMAARIPYAITHAGSGNLGGTPYKIIATGPLGALSPEQIVINDLITRRELATYGGATGKLPPGEYRMVIALRRGGSGYDIIAEQAFRAVENPDVRIVGPAQAEPGERVAFSLDGGYATHYEFGVVEAGDKPIGRGNALYRGAGGSLAADLMMPDREGTFDIVVRRDGEVIARRPITIGAGLSSVSAKPGQAAPGQDALPLVRATFRIPPNFPETPLSWSAVPLDPDMSPEAWAPQTESWVAEGEFEPGRYDVSTMGPGEVAFRAVVEIVPGQPNDFVIPVAGGE